MKKSVSIVLLCALLLMCFSGCSSLNINDDEDKSNNSDNSTLSGTEDDKEDGNEPGNIEVELNNLFTKLQNDSDKSEKILFFIEYQDLHFQLKESGKYNDEKWSEPTIIVTVNCNYNLATDEDWYKACSNTDVKTLNTALFNEYSYELSEGHFTPLGIAPALYFKYDHSETNLSDTIAVFYSDYEVLKQFVNLPYVKDISIGYYYSMPNNYFAESFL